jgi:hypothetical protein
MIWLIIVVIVGFIAFGMIQAREEAKLLRRHDIFFEVKMSASSKVGISFVCKDEDKKEMIKIIKEDVETSFNESTINAPIYVLEKLGFNRVHHFDDETDIQVSFLDDQEANERLKYEAYQKISLKS